MRLLTQAKNNIAALQLERHVAESCSMQPPPRGAVPGSDNDARQGSFKVSVPIFVTLICVRHGSIRPFIADNSQQTSQHKRDRIPNGRRDP